MPTVLLHGFLGSARNLASLARRWSERSPELRLVALDLPGHGGAPPLPPEADLTALARAVLGTTAQLDLEGPLRIVGHSLGGRVGLRVLDLAPERVAATTLLDIAPGPLRASPSEDVLGRLREAPGHARDRGTMRAFLRAGGLEAPVVEWLLMNLVPDGAGFRWRFDREALAALFTRTNAEDLWEVVARHSGRIRCVRGGRSPYVSVADVDRFRSLGVPVEELPTAGHQIHVEQLEELVSLLADT